MAKRLKKPTPPKGCTIKSQHGSESAAKTAQQKLKGKGRNSRIITRRPKGKDIFYVTDCGATKK